jgi:FkbM family methyltransferase
MAIGGQYGEDDILLKFFQDINYGFVVDVGAADGKDNSNTYNLLKKLGWKGILVEPEPIQFKALQERYEHNDDVLCLNCAVDAEMGTKPFWCGLQVSTMVPAWRDACVKAHGIDYKEIEVDTMPLDLIMEGADAPEEFEFLSIDCEGMDFAVLQTLNLKKYKPQMICLEGHGYTIEGYAQYKTTVGNSLYVRAN